jgi:integrase
MEPEKFLTPAEFNALLKAAKDDRERCILLLLAGAGLRVGEMTQIKAEDIDFRKGYLHVQATNAKFKKPRTVVLLPQVAEVLQKQLAGRSKGWLFPSYREGHISFASSPKYSRWHCIQSRAAGGQAQGQSGQGSAPCPSSYAQA